MGRKILLIIILLYSSLISIAQENQKSKGDPDKDVKSTNSTAKTMALVVGISDYQKIKRLDYADDDAQLFYQYLIDQKICRKQDVVRLIDSAATTIYFYRELDRLLETVTGGDRLFIYFSGHGDVENKISSGFLLTYNCEPNNYPAYAIDISMLERYVNAFINKKVNVILITDACRSGTLAGGLVGAAHTISYVKDNFKSIVKILSCQPDQLSIERYMPGGGHGLFTYHLVDGLSGLADKNGDSLVSLVEIRSYLDTVRKITDESQVPEVVGHALVKIGSYDNALKKALLAKKGADTTSYASLSKNSVDSAWKNNPFYLAFENQLRKHNYISPNDDNAYQTLVKATNQKQDPAMLFDMKLSLVATLEDQAQELISNYVRGEDGNNIEEFIERLEMADKYLETVIKLIDKKSLRYNEIKIKKDFFEAFIIYRKGQKEKYKQANEIIRQAIKARPGQAWLHNLSGMLYAETKEYAEAEKNFKEAAELSPTWAYPWHNLGTIAIENNKDSMAIVYYHKAINIDSGFSLALNNLGSLYEKADLLYKSEFLYEKAVQNDPDNGYMWINLGNVYFTREKYKEAESAFGMAIRLGSEFNYVWNNLGLIYTVKKDYKKAESSLKLAAYYYPDWAKPWHNLADLYKKTGETEKATDAFYKALEKKDNNKEPGKKGAFIQLFRLHG